MRFCLVSANEITVARHCFKDVPEIPELSPFVSHESKNSIPTVLPAVAETLDPLHKLTGALI
jgi:hypothetical protein